MSTPVPPSPAIDVERAVDLLHEAAATLFRHHKHGTAEALHELADALSSQPDRIAEYEKLGSLVMDKLRAAFPSAVIANIPSHTVELAAQEGIESRARVASLESQLEESRREHRNEIDRREEIISADRDALVVWMQKELNIDLDDLPAVRAMFDTMPPRSVSSSEPARSERDTGEAPNEIPGEDPTSPERLVRHGVLCPDRSVEWWMKKAEQEGGYVIAAGITQCSRCGIDLPARPCGPWCPLEPAPLSPPASEP